MEKKEKKKEHANSKVNKTQNNNKRTNTYLINKNISIHISCQQFECSKVEINDNKSLLIFASNQKKSDVVYPFCGGNVHIYDNSSTTLKDMPRYHN